MVGSVARRAKLSVYVSSARFLRDVTASVLATGVATLVFSHLSHEPAVHRLIPGRILADTPVWEQETVPVRATRIYDTVAMFGLRIPDAAAWSDTGATVVAASDDESEKLVRPRFRNPLHLAQAETTPARLAPLPPSGRPVTAIAAQPAPENKPVPADRHLRVFGWSVPGSDLLPEGGEAIRKVASLGGRVASLGDAVVESVGLK